MINEVITPPHNNTMNTIMASEMSPSRMSVNKSYMKKSKRSPEYWKREVDKIKNGADAVSQYEFFLEKTRKLEVQAQRKQQQIDLSRDQAGIEDIIEVNEMYIESLQGKLELLNQIENFK